MPAKFKLSTTATPKPTSPTFFLLIGNVQTRNHRGSQADLTTRELRDQVI